MHSVYIYVYVCMYVGLHICISHKYIHTANNTCLCAYCTSRSYSIDTDCPRNDTLLSHHGFGKISVAEAGSLLRFSQVLRALGWLRVLSTCDLLDKVRVGNVTFISPVSCSRCCFLRISCSLSFRTRTALFIHPRQATATEHRVLSSSAARLPLLLVHMRPMSVWDPGWECSSIWASFSSGMCLNH